MGNTFVDLEAAFPLNVRAPRGSGAAMRPAPDRCSASAGRCISASPRTTSCSAIGTWWRTAFQDPSLHEHSGVVQPLALFDPPIDPGMLVAAAAAGIDIGSIVNGLNRPVGPLRSLP